MPDTPLPDAKILGGILLLQSALHAETSEKQLGEFLDAGMRQIPGVRGVALNISGKLHGNIEALGEDIPSECLDCQSMDRPTEFCISNCGPSTDAEPCYRAFLQTDR